jgi:putative ABC transport system permease protein
MGLVFGLLLLATLLTVLLVWLWALGGLFGANKRGKPDQGFAIVAELGPLHAEVSPRAVVAGVGSFFGVVAGLVVSIFSLDRWGEVFDTIKRNKLRTTLTSVSVAWGIFVLVVLLGLGHGLNNGVRHSFRREAQNGVFITATKTSIPYGGYGVGRRLTFDNRDYAAAQKVKGIDHLSGQYFIHGGRFGGGEMKTQRGMKSNAFDVNAVHADAYYMGANEMVEGRFLNTTDVATRRKAAVIGRPVRDFLFEDGEDPIGQWIVVGGVPFQVVGVFSDEGGEENERQIYIPVTTAQLAFHGVDHLGMLSFTVGNASAAEAKAITREIVANLAAAHQFSPDDPQAARVFDNVEGHEKFNKFFLTISIFVVVIGLGTLAAGVVGVSNIMMIAVKERTKEIGIRKALGATPQSIVAMIVHEAVFLTSIAGLLGLSAGVLFLGAIPHLVDTELIRNPSVDIGVGVIAALGLVIAGALAGYVPARAAARVNPVHTLRDQ